MPEGPLLVLGGGRHQVRLIARAAERGIRVAVSDYYPDAPGKAIAAIPRDLDALDVDANIAFAREIGAAGVVTTGTDMAVSTMAAVAEACGLPCWLSAEGARIATNKALAHEAIVAHGGVRPACARVTTPDNPSLGDVPLPAVVKPADSQGQRGVRRVEDRSALAAAVTAALSHSRVGVAVVEQFVSGGEITANAWVTGGEVRLLAVTDRITYNPPPSIGIAFRHVFPSAWAAGRHDEVVANAAAAAAAYGMTEGPLYIQMLVDDDAIHVVEAGARVGGGHEAGLIPLVAGADVTDPVIDLALTGSGSPGSDPAAATHALVNFVLARPGSVASISGLDPLPEGVAEGGFYIRPGAELKQITDGQGRVGYFIATAGGAEALRTTADAAYASLRILDEAGRNLVFVPEPELVSG
jgi:biotin carboxylase